MVQCVAVALRQIYIISIETTTDLCCPSLVESHNFKTDSRK